jgi:hypothetical protein
MSDIKIEPKLGESVYVFWTKALVGRTITSLGWDDGRLTDFELDDGRKIYIISNENSVATLCIED